MQDCGGLITALNTFTPNMPKFDKLIVPPWNSAGCNLFARALAASSFTSLEIVARPLLFAAKTIGVISPLSVETATLTSTSLYLNEEKRIIYYCTKLKRINYFVRRILYDTILNIIYCHLYFILCTYD